MVFAAEAHMGSNRLLSFLLMRPAFSSRNLTSLALVAFFIGVYVAAGGKVTTIPPDMKPGAGFGSVVQPNKGQANSGKGFGEMVDDFLPNLGFDGGRQQKPAARDQLAEGRNVPDSAANTDQAPVAAERSRSGEEAKDMKRSTDGLSAIEQRLKQLRRQQEKETTSR